MIESKTQEEVKQEFIDAVRSVVWFWSEQSSATSRKDLCEGVAFSIMSIIDGVSGSFPCSLDLVCRPHEDDKDFDISEGEKWIEDGMVINECMLHEEILERG